MRLLRGAIRSFLALAVVTFQLRSEAQIKARAYQVKAAYLLNFSRLAQWSRAVLPDGPAPFVSEQRVEADPIIVQRLGAGDNLSSCRLVFFRSSERKNTPAAIAALARRT